MDMNTFFDKAFDYVIKNEGTKYTNDPRDSGGPTKFGVTLKAYQKFMGRLVLYTDIQNLTLEGAKCFYNNEYWIKMHCDQMKKYSVATALFDTSVLYGLEESTLLAQKTLFECGAKVTIDGVMGSETISLLNQINDTLFMRVFVAQIHDRIDDVITKHPHNEAFRVGWVVRANRLLNLTTNKEVS